MPRQKMAGSDVVFALFRNNCRFPELVFLPNHPGLLHHRWVVWHRNAVDVLPELRNRKALDPYHRLNLDDLKSKAITFQLLSDRELAHGSTRNHFQVLPRALQEDP